MGMVGMRRHGKVNRTKDHHCAVYMGGIIPLVLTMSMFKSPIMGMSRRTPEANIKTYHYGFGQCETITFRGKASASFTVIISTRTTRSISASQICAPQARFNHYTGLRSL